VVSIFFFNSPPESKRISKNYSFTGDEAMREGGGDGGVVWWGGWAAAAEGSRGEKKRSTGYILTWVPIKTVV